MKIAYRRFTGILFKEFGGIYNKNKPKKSPLHFNGCEFYFALCRQKMKIAQNPTKKSIVVVQHQKYISGLIKSSPMKICH